jgi:aminoglycoside phosphotransferase
VLRWLGGRAGAPRVQHFEESAGRGWLFLSAVPGRAAAALAGEVGAERLLRALARALRQLHELPVADCPFQRGVEHMVHEAWRRARAGLVDLDAFEPRHRGLSADDLLRELEAKAPAEEDLVFVHGDYCLPNILLSGPGPGGPRRAALKVTGLVDWGRAGIADRYQDLALLLRSFDRNTGSRLPDLLAREYGLTALDEAKLSFYQLLDGFF